MKIIITSGATREPIDSVRYITNLSSGETGRALGKYFQEQNFEVVSLYGKGSAKPENVKRALEFESFEDLNSMLQKILNEEIFDAIIHLAAVSDYSVKDVYKGKIESAETDLHLTLKKNFKILDRIKLYAKAKSKAPFVIAFKLTDNPDKAAWLEAVQKIYRRHLANGEACVDLVVHNDLSDFNKGDHNHHFRLINQGGIMLECQSTLSLGEQLAKILRRL